MTHIRHVHASVQTHRSMLLSFYQHVLIHDPRVLQTGPLLCNLFCKHLERNLSAKYREKKQAARVILLKESIIRGRFICPSIAQRSFDLWPTFCFNFESYLSRDETAHILSNLDTNFSLFLSQQENKVDKWKYVQMYQNVSRKIRGENYCEVRIFNQLI